MDVDKPPTSSLAQLAIVLMKSEGFGAHFLTAMSLSLHFVCYVFFLSLTLTSFIRARPLTAQEKVARLCSVSTIGKGSTSYREGALVADKATGT
jgi:hypothetical protein